MNPSKTGGSFSAALSAPGDDERGGRQRDARARYAVFIIYDKQTYGEWEGGGWDAED